MKKSSVLEEDILITGAGLAGLTLVYRAIKEGIWSDRRILIFDKKISVGNPKLISFWTTDHSFFSEFQDLTWNKLRFVTKDSQEVELDIEKYFYRAFESTYLLNLIIVYLKKQPNIEFLQEEVISIKNEDSFCEVYTNVGCYRGQYVFNSIFRTPEITKKERYLLQHFKGVKVFAKDFKVNTLCATIMDYRTSQRYGTSFFYCLPMSDNELFVEYTVFSKSVLKQGAYDQEIHHYIDTVLEINNYEIIEAEFGVIPMTDYRFLRKDGNIVNIGTAGGDTRGSTGYTFTNVQKTITFILNQFKISRVPDLSFKAHKKEKFYDALLLRVLDDNNYQGCDLFGDLFINSKASNIFKFLDSDSSFFNDIKIITSLKPKPFLMALNTFIKEHLFR